MLFVVFVILKNVRYYFVLLRYFAATKSLKFNHVNRVFVLNPSAVTDVLKKMERE